MWKAKKKKNKRRRKKKALKSHLVFSEELHKCLKKWKMCIASSDDRAYKFRCVCFKTQSHFFRDLNWTPPSPRTQPSLDQQNLCYLTHMVVLFKNWVKILKSGDFKYILGFLVSSGKSEDLAKLFPQPRMTVPSWNPVPVTFFLKETGWRPSLPLSTILTSLCLIGHPSPSDVCCSVWYLFNNLCHLPLDWKLMRTGMFFPVFIHCYVLCTEAYSFL